MDEAPIRALACKPAGENANPQAPAADAGAPAAGAPAGPGARELEDHVASLLTPHKRPREVRYLEALPRNAMGKVTKATLGS